MTDLMKGVAEEIVGKERVVHGVRTMGGEDMSLFLARVPGAFAFVGSAPPGTKASRHHSPTFDIDEAALGIGADLLARTAVRYLQTGGSDPPSYISLHGQLPRLRTLRLPPVRRPP